ncbi:hypothetical protein [Rhizobium sp. 18065]|uniref:hypothetical protein n=1 Tax=Rhizobium sp. 18065 TaxID=2681411 RepID=UPI00135A77A2|nr:hypothetical protein [Rhizobium sp. 18065]
MDPKLTEDQLALLTEEERAGLLEDEEDDDGGDDGDDTGGDDAGAAASASDDTEGDEKDGDAGDDDAGAAKADQQQQAAPSPAASAAADDVAADADEPVETTPRWILPADFKDQQESIKKGLAELATKFDAGELTADEFMTERGTLEEKSTELLRRQITADVQRETAIDTWKGEVSTFMGDHPQYKSPVLQGLLDAEVRKLQAESVNPLNPKLLAKAHANIASQIEAAYGVKSEGKKPDDNKTPAKPAGKPRPEIPPTLSSMPASDISDADDGGEFAHLDRLLDRDSQAYEKELAKLSPDVRDRYLAQ